MTINSDSTPETTTGMEIIARDLPSYEDNDAEGLQDVASLSFGNDNGAEGEERLSSNQPRTLFALFNKTNTIICGVLGVILLMFVAAISSAAVTSSNIVNSFNGPPAPKSSKAPKSTKQPTATKQPKAKVVKVKVKGSSTPIAGSTKLTPGCVDDEAACDSDRSNGGDFNSDGCKKYFKCLGKKDNGPVFVKPWWFDRDVSYSAFAFEEGKVCASVPGIEKSSKTSFELWDQDYLGEPLDQFRDFKVNYEIEDPGSTGSSVAFVNFYVRAQPGKATYYDCNFVFEAPDETAGAQDEIFFDLDTPSNNARICPASKSYCVSPVDTGCVTGNSIRQYLAANPTAVFGVGNKEWYSFVLTTGSTNQDDQGLDVCWSDVSFTRVEDGKEIINNYEFTSLN